MFYDIEYYINKETLRVDMILACKLWSNNKISALLENPLSLNTHGSDTSARLEFITDIIINAEFYKLKYNQHILQKSNKLSIKDINKSLNQFFCSLMVSQLEFQFPLVFSPLVRQRVLKQEMYLAPISHALSNSSQLIPVFIKMISRDKTATTIYILLYPRREIKTDYILNIL